METDFKSDEDVRMGLNGGFVSSIDFFVEIKYSGIVRFRVFVKFYFMAGKFYFNFVKLN